MSATATFGASPAEAALANKKQMRTALIGKDAALTIKDQVLAAAAKSKSVLMGVLESLHLDSLASGIIGLAKTVYRAVWTRVSQVLGLFARAIGWSNAIGWLATHKPSRDKAVNLTARAAAKLTFALTTVGTWMAKVPLVGKPTSQVFVFLTLTPLRWASAAIDKGVEVADRYQNSSATRWLFSMVRINILSRVVRTFVPANLRMLGWAVGLGVMYGPGLVEVVKEETAERTEKPASAPKAQPAKGADFSGGNAVPHFEVKVRKTGSIALLEITTDPDDPEMQVVTWDGKRYDIKDVGEAEGDPIEPTLTQRTRTIEGLSQQASRAARREQAKAHGPKAKANR